MIYKIVPVDSVIVRRGANACNTGAFLPVVVFTQVAGAVVTPYRNRLTDFRFILIFNRTGEPASFLHLHELLHHFYRNIMNNFIRHANVYHRIHIVYEWLYICLSLKRLL